MGEECSTHGRDKKCMRFGRRTKGKILLGRPGSRSEYNIKIERKEVGCKGMDWIHLAQDRD
jgi:hypothetical protein